MAHQVTLIPGDGIGPEISAAMREVVAASGVDIDWHVQEAGAKVMEAEGTPLPEHVLDSVRETGTALKGPVTTPVGSGFRSVNVALRRAFDLFACVRPCLSMPGDGSRYDGVDLVIVRELTGGLYFGERHRFYDEPGAGANGAPGQRAVDTLEYREYEVERIARQAFEAACRRRGHVTSVDKANVLDTSRMWREVVHRVHDADYPDVTLDDMLVDNTAMQLINRPAFFDVVVTENMFGDILSDEAAQITGSLGMLASASLGDGVALYEPSHGSAPDIAGKGIANPLAQILSVEMMLRYSFDMGEAADAVHAAVEAVLDEGWRTGDIADASTPTDHVLGTVAMGDKVVEHI